MAYVQTTTGIHVDGKSEKGPEGYTLAQAQASAEERNKRAEAMGIKARYEAAGS